ncbi:hypothetical protein HAX54_007614, partial [Datura stramonium]|nr:hypothetical protein [Datura stramonium]
MVELTALNWMMDHHLYRRGSVLSAIERWRLQRTVKASDSPLPRSLGLRRSITCPVRRVATQEFHLSKHYAR